MTRARRCLLGWIALSVSLAGCSRDPASQARDELATARSWAATTRMVGEAWAAGAVPGPYAADALEAARASSEDEAAAVSAEPDVAAMAPLDLAARFHAIASIAAELRGAVESGDRGALDRGLARLADEERAIGAAGGGA